MKRKLYIFALALPLLFSCKKDENYADPRLVGKWTDFNTSYTFSEDKTFYSLYLRSGMGSDTILVDSIFGTYSVNKKKNVLNFSMHGYRKKDSLKTIVMDNRNMPAWNYSFDNDSTLTYRTSTAYSKLFKKK
ncbi:hypothetical protein [Sporocytophaga myxococcoides]|uniref:hypothetical protein n=1 Tax=Sporocytophaga myxococcoides TaxID=153721 RepID=UPI00048C9BF2|nr:hypothetical protein [Sporocytophaga myxococcoides]